MFIKPVQIKHRRPLIRIDNSPRLFQKSRHSRLGRRATNMHGLHHLSIFLITNLHPRRPRSRLKFPNISHTPILPQNPTSWTKFPICCIILRQGFGAYIKKKGSVISVICIVVIGLLSRGPLNGYPLYCWASAFSI